MNDEIKDIPSILESSMNDLKKNNKGVFEMIINKYHEGFFITHQSQGSLKDFAKEIFDMFDPKEHSNES